jgi:hypothetical protein
MRLRRFIAAINSGLRAKVGKTRRLDKQAAAIYNQRKVVLKIDFL